MGKSVGQLHVMEVEGGEDAPPAGRREPGFGMIPAAVFAIRVEKFPPGYVIGTYAALAQHADRAGVCWPSLKQLQRMTGWSRPTILKAMELLEQAQLLEVQHQTGDDGGTRSNRYVLTAHTADGELRRVRKLAMAVTQGTPVNSTDRGVNSVDRPPVNSTDHPSQSSLLKQHQLTEPRENDAPSLGPALPFRLPADFTVTPEMRAGVAKYGLSAAELDFETEKFIDHYRGTGAHRLDWLAVWRNWIRRERDYRGPRRGSGERPAAKGNQAAMERVQRVIAKIEEKKGHD